MAREHAAPVVNGAKRFGVDAIHRAASVAADAHQPDIAEHLQVLRNRRLSELECVRDVGHRLLVASNELEDVTATRFGDRVERIRVRRGARHDDSYTFPYGNVSTHARFPRTRRPPSCGWGDFKSPAEAGRHVRRATTSAGLHARRLPCTWRPPSGGWGRSPESG